MRHSRLPFALLVLSLSGPAFAQDWLEGRFGAPGFPEASVAERPRVPGSNLTCPTDSSLISGIQMTVSGTVTLNVTLQLPSGVPAGTRITVTVETKPNYCAPGTRQSTTSDALTRVVSGLPNESIYFVFATYEGCAEPSVFRFTNSFSGSPAIPNLQGSATGPNQVTLQLNVPGPYGLAARFGRGTTANPGQMSFNPLYSLFCPIGAKPVFGDSPGAGSWFYVLQVAGTRGNGFQSVFSNVVGVNVSTSCPTPATPLLLATSLPSSARAGTSVLVPWTQVLGARYRLEIATDAAFSFGTSTIETDDTSALVATPATPPQSGRLYFRVRAENPCNGLPVTSPYSDIRSLPITARPPTLAFVKGGPEWVTSIGKAPPTATVRVRNTGNSSGIFDFNPTGSFFDVSPTKVTIGAGAETDLALTAKTGTTSTARNFSGTLDGTIGNPIPLAVATTPAVSTTVSLTVTGSAVAPGSRTGTRFKASKSKLVFSAPPGGTPIAQTFDLSLANVVGNGPVTISASVGPGGSWLRIPAEIQTPLASGQTRSLTFTVDRSKRSLTEARSPWRALLRLSPVGGGPDDTLVIEVIDVEPPALDSGAGFRIGGTAPAAGTSFFIPTTVKATSATGADLTSDGWIRNEGATDAAVTMFFTPDGKDGVLDPGVSRAQTTIPSGATFRVADLLTTVFKLAGSGQVEVRGLTPGQLTVRSTVESVVGGEGASRFGTEIPVASFGQGIGADGTSLFIPGIREDADNRTNLILTETAGSEATARITLFDDNGKPVGSVLSDRKVPAFGKIQFNQIVKTILPNGSLSGGTLQIELTAGFGKVVALATVIDNKSGSFSAVSAFDPRANQAAAARKKDPSTNAVAGLNLVVPSVARVTGANNTQFFTTLSLSNITATTAVLQLVYHYIDASDGNKTKTATANVSIPGRGSLPLSQGRDAIASVFHLTNQTYGWISLGGDVERVVATAGVSALVDPLNPAKGLKTAQVNGIFSTSPDFALLGAGDRRFSGMEKSVQRRTNLILVETAGQACNAQLRLFDAAGSPLDERTVPLAANQYFQVNDVIGSFGLGDGPYQNIGVTATVLNGGCQIVGLATVLDNQSRNPQIFVLQAPGPPPGSTFGF